MGVTAAQIVSDDRWYVLHLNPEPWALGPLSVGRRGGKPYPFIGPNPTLVAYQEAIREELVREDQPPPEKLTGPVELTFYFWRQVERYEDAMGRQRTRKAADLTNLQKATEDALNGVLFDDDRQTRVVRSEIIDQDIDTRSAVVIRARPAPGVLTHESLKAIPTFVWEQMQIIDLTGTSTQPLLDGDREATF